MQIAIDGPAGSGKSTVAKIVAKKFNFVYVDTGAMYRAVTLYAKINQIDYEDEQEISEKIPLISLNFIPADPVQKVILNDQDVTEAIRSQEITNNVSLVSSYQKVRDEMTERQRQMTENSSVVMDGRDIGTTVLPNADVKIFLIASVDRSFLSTESRFSKKTIVAKANGSESIKDQRLFGEVPSLMIAAKIGLNKIKEEKIRT